MYFTATLITFLLGSANTHSTFAIENNANESVVNLRAARGTSRAIEYDCSKGCASIIDPVCANGITFQNACIAQCQGVELLAPGACNSDDKEKEVPSHRFVQRKTMDTSSGKEQHHIDTDVMNLYAEEGFKYTGSEDNEEFTEADEVAFQNQVAMDMGGVRDEKDSLGSVARFTGGGDVYFAESSNEMIAAFEKEFGAPEVIEVEEESFEKPPPLKSGEMDAETIINDGIDTRSQVTNYPGTMWPYWRVVSIGNNVCSGTIIGRNKILTNAHCVYDRGTRQWRVPTTVSPGRNGSTPWGSWSVKHATILTSYMTTANWWEEDYAIITTHHNIGDYMGTFRLTYTTCDGLDQELTDKRIVGYPGDKPSGTMWDSSDCQWYYQCGNKVAYHQCDIFYGSSGSGMLMFADSNNVNGVVGIHSFSRGTCSNCWNGGPAFTESIAAMLNSW